MKQMNKDVFLRAGGLNCVIQLLRLVHTSNWKTSIRAVKVLELVLLNTLFHLAATFKYRRFVLTNPTYKNNRSMVNSN